MLLLIVFVVQTSGMGGGLFGGAPAAPGGGGLFGGSPGGGLFGGAPAMVRLWLCIAHLLL